MTASIHPLVDFLNHGILPFTGRAAVAARIVELWQGGAEAHGLRALLLYGEAGIGKSRMVEEIASDVKRANGAVVHTKLYPESATSIAPLVARAIWRFSAAHPLLKIEPEETLPSVLAALRRLARLRQAILIFEDLHLLNGEGIADFAALLDALADEPVTVLCLARPAELGVRPLLERHLVDEIELDGLGRSEIEELWRELFGAHPEPPVTAMLLEATAGNPLAIRSALRGALKSGAIAQSASGAWRVTLASDALGETLGRNVKLLTEGMAAHLTEREREAASAIACLGEVVSRETAAAMIGGDRQILGLLAFKGILVENGALVPPLSGAPSEHPLLAFTHTLLHRRLAENAPVEADRIARIIIDELPLYSTVPFALLAKHADRLTASPEDLLRLIELAIASVRRLEGGTDWRIGLELWNVANGLFERHEHLLDEGDRFRLRAVLFERHIRLLRGRDTSEEYRRTAEEFLKHTDRPLPAELLEYRLHAFRGYYWMSSRRDYAATEAIRREVDAFLAIHPELRRTQAYVDYLARVAHASSAIMDLPTIRAVESELKALLDSDAPEELKRRAWRAISPHFLMVFSTPEELEARLRLVEELEADPIATDAGLRLTKITLYANIGRERETLEAIEQAIPWYRDRGQYRSSHYCALMGLYCRAALSASIGTLAEEAEAICAEADEVAPRIRIHGATFFAVAGILRGDAAWGKQLATSLLGDAGELDVILELGAALGVNDDEAIDSLIARDEAPFPAVRRHLRGEGELAAAVEEAGAIFREPIFRTSDMMETRILAELIDHFSHRGAKELAAAVKDGMHDFIIRALAWLDRHALLPYVAAMVGRFNTSLTRTERSSWNARLADLSHDATDRKESSHGASIELSMLGAIELRVPGEEPLRPRGVRLRTLLGLMVADRMLEKPLSQREFCRLAASEAAEFEDARKTVNLTVYRLRELMGHEAILTDQETPRLNLEKVRIDLLRAHTLLVEAAAAIRDGSLPRAYAPLEEALEIAAGEVPFPTLYDDFFEAAREDFENRMRLTVLRLVKGLLLDGDAAGAEVILRRAFAAMPEDEELASLLAEALVRLGKRTEAERVKIKLQVDGAAAV